MSSGPQVLAFAGVVLLGAMSPGPDFAVVVRRSALSGRHRGMAAAVGVAAGVFVWAAAAATGVAALVAASAFAFTAVKIVGAAYLFYLGIRSLHAATRRRQAAPEPTGGSGDGGWAAFREGLLCNVLNPKAAVFFLALMPQFVSADASLADTLALSAAGLAAALAWFLAVANLVGALRRLFARPAARRAIDAVSGAALIALGVRLVTTSRT
ncbi:lysine transporter LysE [Sphaerisporangium rufum]|uniref:Lysine transporter LysE n=1 Tax=Sphaerisporangium rufum TaxID=1381558 RepID=A0A919UWT0_9ACTN|nr:LysE family translocator [Sphaerisporangium rufum]GII75149.1 lysine transporter LysE [Sphaerisporangium rufum]